MNPLNYEIHLVDNCNLNCAGCSHFSPLAEPNELTPETYEDNLKKISQNVLDKMTSIRLLGGEPLLNKDINEIIKISRKYFKNAYITIITNGILLRRMSDLFYDTCKDNNVAITITYYGLNLNYDDLYQFIKDKGLDVYFWGMSDGEKTFFRYPINLSGTENYEENYKECWCIKDWQCLQLDGTKLYCCNIGPYIKYFNKKFNTNIVDNEYLDLSQINDYSEVEEWFSKPKKICGYCDRNNIQTIKWKHSKQDISEWT